MENNASQQGQCYSVKNGIPSGIIPLPDESHTLYTSLPFDATNLTKEEIIAIDSKTFIIVHFVDEDGQPLTEFLYPGDTPYPSQTP